MFGDIATGSGFGYRTLEDELREVKVAAETAIPAGVFELEFVKSPKFGPDSIALLDVPGFDNILIHAGNTDVDTKGCIIVGDRIDELAGQISGGAARHVLDRLKRELRAAFDRGERVFLVVRNAPDDRYVDSGNPVPIIGAEVA